jgi:hypothetical protein
MEQLGASALICYFVLVRGKINSTLSQCCSVSLCAGVHNAAAFTTGHTAVMLFASAFSVAVLQYMAALLSILLCYTTVVGGYTKLCLLSQAAFHCVK